MAHKIDTANAVATMPVAAAAGTPGWFADADPLNPTHLDADWCNMVQGELTNIVLAFGGSLTKGVVDQIATALVEYVLTNGRFGDSLYAIKDITAPDGYRFKIFPVMVPGVTRANLRVDFVSANAILIGLDGSEVKVIDENADATFRDMTASRDIKAGGTFGGPADAPLPITKRALTASVDWATSAAEIEGSPVVSYEDSTEVEITLTIANSDSGPHDVEMGSTVLIDVSGIQATGGTLISAFAHTTAGSTNAQKGLRWSCGIMLNSSGNPKLAVTSVGKATAAIGGSGTNESVTVKVYLTFAALKAV